MCGIVGYVGKRSAQDVLLDGLEKLEYRGYDSAGVALALDGGIRVVKSKGRLTALREKLAAQQLAQSFCGIGHTRWATHGEPSDVNSHPHSTPDYSVVFHSFYLYFPWFSPSAVFSDICIDFPALHNFSELPHGYFQKPTEFCLCYCSH